VLAELVAILAADNQAATKAARESLVNSVDFSFYNGFVSSTQIFAWRVTPLSGESTGQWIAPIIAIAVALLLTGVGISYVVRGAISFGRAFAGGLICAVVAAQIATIVGAIISVESSSATLYGNSVYGGNLAGGLDVAVFGSISGVTFIGSVMFGIIAGLGTAFAAITQGATEAAERVVWTRPSGSSFAPGVPPQMPPVSATTGSAWPPRAPGTGDDAGGRHSRTD
jgi:hypothetical protein